MVEYLGDIEVLQHMQNGLARAHISGRQTPGLTPHLLYKKGSEPRRVKPGVWRPEIWALLIRGLGGGGWLLYGQKKSWVENLVTLSRGQFSRLFKAPQIFAGQAAKPRISVPLAG
jgi:hypothetical protein